MKIAPIASVIARLGLVYLFTAFIAGNYDPMLWSMWMRGLFVVWVIYVMGSK